MFNYAIFGLIGSALLLLVSGQEQCPACNRKYAPVCAWSTDGTGQEYGNRCSAECAGYAPDSVTDGQCPDPPCICTLEWSPVCASNGVLFGNECQMTCSGFERGDDSRCLQVSQLPAAVKRSYRRQFCACQSIWAVVCDQDGNSYANTCTAKCAGLDEDSVSAEFCSKKRI